MRYAMTEDVSAQSFISELDELVFLIEEVPRKLRRVFDNSNARLKLSRSQWRALAYIFRTPGLSQTELAKCLERASVGHVIDQLEMAGYVERRALEGNRRVWTLHLLPKAIGILPSLRAEADAVYARLLAGVPLGDVANVKRLLAAMSANLD